MQNVTRKDPFRHGKRYDWATFPIPSMSFKPYLAELLGTFVLTLVVILGSAQLATLAIPVPYLAGITLGLFVYTVGWISGAHLNPAVTIGLATIKKISVQEAVYYMLAQFLGAIAASLALAQLTGRGSGIALGDNTMLVTLAEAMGTFILAWGVMSAVEGKISKGASGLVVGTSLTLGALIAWGVGSNGVINPAVALGAGSFGSAYLVGPIVGSIVACWLFRWFTQQRDAVIS